MLIASLIGSIPFIKSRNWNKVQCDFPGHVYNTDAGNSVVKCLLHLSMAWLHLLGQDNQNEL